MEGAIYVVWSCEHHLYWGPNRSGYRSSLQDAGRYTREEALGICRGARGGREFNPSPSEVPLLVEDAAAFWPDDRPEWEAERHKRRVERLRIAEEEGRYDEADRPKWCGEGE